MVDDPVTDGMARSLAFPGGAQPVSPRCYRGNEPQAIGFAQIACPISAACRRIVAPRFSGAWALRKVIGKLRNWWATYSELELSSSTFQTVEEVTAAFDEASAKDVGGIIAFHNPTFTFLELIAGLSR